MQTLVTISGALGIRASKRAKEAKRTRGFSAALCWWRAHIIWYLFIGSSPWACTLISDFDVHQCDSDQDCDVSAVTRCEDSRCVPGCTSNRECAAFDPRTPICPRVGSPCAPLLSEDGACYLSSDYDDGTMGALTGDDMLLVGAFAPTFRSSLWLTLELATNELNLGRTLGDAQSLPPVLVTLCDAGRQRAEAGMRHLTETLGSRTVIASLEDSVLRAGVMSAPADTLLISPWGPVSAFDDLGERASMLWYLGARYEEASAAYAAVLTKVLDAALARLADPSAFKLVSIRGGAAEDRALAGAVRGMIRVNGEDDAALLAQGRHRSFDLPEDSAADRAAQLVQIASFAPDVVLVFAGGTFDDSERSPRAAIVHTLESLAGPAWQPFYVFGPRNIEDETLRRLAAANESFRSRAVGVASSPPLDLEIAPGLAARFRNAFPEAVDPSINLDVAFDAYDALFLIIYAQSAAAHVPLRGGPALLRGLEQVTLAGGERLPVGDSDMERAARMLSDSIAFDLRGSRGSLGFQAETHAHAAVPRVYCWGDDGKTRDAAAYSDGGLSVAAGGCANLVLPSESP